LSSPPIYLHFLPQLLWSPLPLRRSRVRYTLCFLCL
jgi:hypothetical protein